MCARKTNQYQVKIQLLPSTFDAFGRAGLEQRLTCFLIDDCVAIDAGSIGIALTPAQRSTVRDIVITHTHIDHIATLPVLIDDLFGALREPLRVHATAETIELLERDVFNWQLYPRFSELSNEHTPVMRYVPFRLGEEFSVAHLQIMAVAVNHAVPSVGLLVSDHSVNVAFSSDTAETEEFWHLVNQAPHLAALLIECSFPNAMAKLARISKHLTPAILRTELSKLVRPESDILTVHLKPAYRAEIVKELAALNIARLQVMTPGRVYEW